MTKLADISPKADFQPINQNEVLLLFSGGIDSTTLLWMLGKGGTKVHALHTDHAYGKMRETARKLVGLAQELFGGEDRVIWQYVDLSPIFKSLLSSGNKYLPGFRMWMYLAALSKADELGLWNIYSAELLQPFINSGEHSAEDPGAAMLMDTTGMDAEARASEFAPKHRQALAQLYARMYKSPYDDYNFTLAEPFVGITKPALIRIGTELGAPLHLTMTCRNPEIEILHGHSFNCGRSTCFTCCERKAGFLMAGIEDQTVYAYEEPIPTAYLDKLRLRYEF